jgi:hypothetical protein
MDTYYNGEWRMDWMLGNPNTTAVLIACLMMATWSMALAWEKGFHIALVLSTALACGLVETYSRGGMIALICGTVVLLAWTPRPWPRARWIGGTIALWVLGAFVLFSRAQTRYGQGLFSDDESIDNRLAIWRHVPEMIAAAPWGWANAGDAYTQWFQPAARSVNYLNLINSHFNFMVEGGWLGSATYVFAWWMVFLLCWPSAKSRLRAVPLAVWVAFGVGACFSHVEKSAWLWLVPLATLFFVLAERIRLSQWPRTSFVFAGGFGSVAIVVLLVLIGLETNPLPIHNHQGVVILGTGNDCTVILVDRTVMGSLYGHAFRKFLANHSELAHHRRYAFVESADRVPATKASQYVVSGRFAADETLVAKIGSSSRIILVNPSGFPHAAQPGGDLQGQTTVYFGEYAETPSRAAWTRVAGVKAVQISGAADFVPSWPEAIWAAPKS